MSEYVPGRSDYLPGDDVVDETRLESPVRRDYRSVPGLLRELVENASLLASRELQLAKAEVGQSISRAKAGVAALATGGAVLFGGFLLLLVALSIYLAQFVPIWGAFAIVGAATLVIGLIMVMAGKKRMDAEAFVPERTVQSMQRDQRMVQEKLS
jgi:hypothetical protein